jgi:hypothetical protein
MKEYFIEDSDGVNMPITKDVVNVIIKDHMISTYYWAVGIFCTIIGFLLGVIA